MSKLLTGSVCIVLFIFFNFIYSWVAAEFNNIFSLIYSRSLTAVILFCGLLLYFTLSVINIFCHVFFVFVFFLQQVTQIDNDLKTRASAYNNLKGNLQNLERKNA